MDGPNTTSRCGAASLLLATIVAFAGARTSGAQTTKPLDPWSAGFVKGVTWGWVGQRGEYEAPAAAESMRLLKATNAEWVCIAFSTTMPTYDTAELLWAADNPEMVSDDEVRHAIRLARDNGLKVILKPTINCGDGTWRAWIRFFRPLTDEERASGATGADDPWGETPGRREGMARDEVKWSSWWSDFSRFLVHYAKLAEQEHVELLCLGCEMNSTEADEARWRELIAAVRAVYGGLITYDVNHGREQDVAWWDAVDVIGLSAYYATPPAEGATVEVAATKTTSKEEILNHFQSMKVILAALSAKYNRPILFIETGATNVRGAARYPWSHPDAHPESPTDESEQANFYAAQFEAFWGEPWFMGFAWWDWPARLYDANDAKDDRSFCVHGKQAEEVLRSWFAKSSPNLHESK